MIVIAAAIIAAAVGAQIYKGKKETRRSLIEVGIDAEKQAQDVKVMMEARQRVLQGLASTSLEGGTMEGI